MQGWVVADISGRTYLVRAGTGVITAVVPVGLADPDGRHAFHRVEIEVDRPLGHPRAIRYSTSAQVASADPLCAVAMVMAQEGRRVTWAIEWHRQDWVPGHLLITSLDLARDAQATLVAIDALAAEPELARSMPEELRS